MNAMNSVGQAARQVVDVLWAYGLLTLYGAYRGIFLPRVFARSNEPLLNLHDETPQETPDNVRAGNLVFAAIAIMSFLFFLNVAGSDILIVMRGNPLWGCLAGLLGTGLFAEIGIFEFLYQQNNRYIDLLTDADAGAASRSECQYRKVVKMERIGMAVWAFLFALAVFWLWQISRAP